MTPKPSPAMRPHVNAEVKTPRPAAEDIGEAARAMLLAVQPMLDWVEKVRASQQTASWRASDHRNAGAKEKRAKNADGFSSHQNGMRDSTRTKTELIVVANDGAAVLFRRNGCAMAPQPLALMEHAELRDQAGKAPAGPVNGDVSRNGRDGKAALHAKSGTSAPFAARLAQRIEREVLDGLFDRVALFAASPLLLALKARLGPHTLAALGAAIDADLTGFPVGEMAYRVDAALALPHPGNRQAGGMTQHALDNPRIGAPRR